MAATASPSLPVKLEQQIKRTEQFCKIDRLAEMRVEPRTARGALVLVPDEPRDSDRFSLASAGAARTRLMS